MPQKDTQSIEQRVISNKKPAPRKDRVAATAKQKAKPKLNKSGRPRSGA